MGTIGQDGILAASLDLCGKIAYQALTLTAEAKAAAYARLLQAVVLE